MNYLKYIVPCIIAIMMHGTISFAQVNFVSNPSFEEINACPSGQAQINRAINWNILLNGGGSTPDLFHTCCSDPFICGVPLNTANLSFQFPHYGTSYVGIEVAYSAFPDNDREYIQNRLIKTLYPGSTYCVKFYASLSNQSTAYIKTLGAYLDSGFVWAPAPHGLADFTPQVYNNTQPLNDTLNWMKVEGTFVANGDEEYITIGNFFPDSSSGIGFIGSPSVWASYYYIDDVSVIDVNLPAFAGNDTVISNSSDSAFIGRQPEIGLNDDCIWYVNGIPIDTVAGLWVYPDTTTIYTLVQTICGNVDTDSVTVYVFPDGISDNNTEQNNYVIAPNPNNGNFSVSLVNNAWYPGNVEIKIWDITGNVLRNCKLDFKNSKAILHTDLPDGMYIISVKDNNGNIYNPKKITIIK